MKKLLSKSEPTEAPPEGRAPVRLKSLESRFADEIQSLATAAA
jgi:hypothetical protein